MNSSKEKRVQEATFLVLLQRCPFCFSLHIAMTETGLSVVGNMAAHHSGGQDRILTQLQLKKKNPENIMVDLALLQGPSTPHTVTRIVVENLYQ